MNRWDVFHSDRLESGRGLTTEQVRALQQSGELAPGDLIRPAGTTAGWLKVADWKPAADAPRKPAAPKATPPKPAPQESPSIASTPTEAWVEPLPQTPSGSFDRLAGTFPPIRGTEPTADSASNMPPVRSDERFAPPSVELDAVEEEFEDRPTETYARTSDRGSVPIAPIVETDDAAGPSMSAGALEALIDDEDLGDYDLNLDRGAAPPADRRDSLIAVPVPEAEVPPSAWAEAVEEYDPEAEDEAAAEFTLTRGGPEKVEELDLAAMVDVAFQLVLFFLVTATTVLFKTLEVPKPNNDAPPAAGATQGTAKSLDDLQNDYILVDIDPSGAFKVDREPAPSTMAGLADRLRAARSATNRTSMLLTADFATQHKNAVIAYDAANEIGLRIAIARPVPANR